MANTYTDLLKLRMPALGDVGWDDEVNDNTKIQEFAFGSVLKSNVVIDGLVPSDGGGLDIDTTAGNVVVGGASFAVAADSVTCTSGVLNWVYVDDAGALQVATTPPTGDYVAIALVDAGSTTITRFGDARNHAEGALTIGVTHTPDNYEADTSETGAINQHLAGIDTQLGLLGGFKNFIINGDFNIAQRGNLHTSVLDGEYTLDRWKNKHTTAGTCQYQLVTDAPAGTGLYRCLQVYVNTAEASPVLRLIQQHIEGYCLKPMTRGPLTLSFWVLSTVTGTYGVVLRNNGSDASYVMEYSINAVDTWEYKTLTFEIDDSVGSGWDYADDIGLQVMFGLAGQASNTLNTWHNANIKVSPSQVNLMAAAGNYFRISGVQLELGEVATPFEHLPYGVQLARCRRYFERIDPANDDACISTLQATSSTSAKGRLAFSKKRAAPGSITTNSQASWTYSRSTGTRYWTTAISFANFYDNGCRVAITGSGLSAGDAVVLDLRSAKVDIDAEL